MMPAPSESLGFEDDIEEPTVREPHGAALRPSKEDQAALDVLLSAAAAADRRRSAGAAARAHRGPHRAALAAAARAAGRPPAVDGHLGGVALLFIAVAIGGAWYVWGRETARPGPKRAAAPSVHDDAGRGQHPGARRIRPRRHRDPGPRAAVAPRAGAPVARVPGRGPGPPTSPRRARSCRAATSTRPPRGSRPPSRRRRPDRPACRSSWPARRRPSRRRCRTRGRRSCSSSP